MKKTYITPVVAAELFSLTRSTSSCSTIQISSVDTICVLKDSDSTPGMRDFAVLGGFLTQNDCSIPVPDMDKEDELCYHTSVAMAFTS